MTARLTTQSTINTPSASLTFRPGTVADSYSVFNIFEETLADLTRRFGSNTPTSVSDPTALAQMWQERRPLYEHLARTAGQFWVAERAGQLVGFSRSTLRGGHLQLTELFVLPGQQSGGVGRELITRAFQTDLAAHRSIMATPDFRAQALYLRMGVYPRFPIYYFGRAPEPVSVTTDLTIEPMTASSEMLQVVGGIDETIVGFRRDVDHSWYAADRQGYLYYREGQPVGYGYTGLRNGPFALLEAGDFPAVLAHAETEAAGQGRDEFGVEAPLVNQTAVDYLLSRGFKLDTFLAMFMSDIPLGNFENYILTSPPFFI